MNSQLPSDSLLSRLRTRANQAKRNCGHAKMTPEQALALIECAESLKQWSTEVSAATRSEKRMMDALVKLEAL